MLGCLQKLDVITTARTPVNILKEATTILDLSRHFNHNFISVMVKYFIHKKGMYIQMVGWTQV